jgi:hypothetical protein
MNDNLDDLLYELEVKEKNQQNKNAQVDEDKKKKEISNRLDIIEQQRAEIERLRAQVAAQQSSSMTLDFTSSEPPSKINNPPEVNNNTPKKRNRKNNKLGHNGNPVTNTYANNYNNNNNKNNNNNDNVSTFANNNAKYVATNTGTIANNAVVANDNFSNISQEDLDLQKLREELAMEEKKLAQKREAEQLRKEIERMRALNSGGPSSSGPNSKSNNGPPQVSPHEKALMDEIERMRQELGSTSYSEKGKIEELEKMRDLLKQEVFSLKSKGPVQVDPMKEQRIAELERKKLQLQRELSSGPSKEELVELHGKNRKELNDIQFGVDVCFLMDCTGSMARQIAAAKDNIRKVVAQVNAIDPRAVLRFAFVGYRDYCDKERFVILNFVDSGNLQEFENVVGSVKAFGGGDGPEDVAGGLDICTKLPWRASTRLLIHIADAPCHGSKYHKLLDDSYPQGDPSGLVPEELLKKLLSLRVDYYFLRMDRFTNIMVAQFKKVYDAAKKTFEVHRVGNDPALFLPKVVASIHSSMAQSVSFRK